MITLYSSVVGRNGIYNEIRDKADVERRGDEEKYNER